MAAVNISFAITRINNILKYVKIEDRCFKLDFLFSSNCSLSEHKRLFQKHLQKIINLKLKR